MGVSGAGWASPRPQQPSCAGGSGRGTPASPPGGPFTSHSGLGAGAGHTPSLGEGNPLRPITEGAGPTPLPGRPRAPTVSAAAGPLPRPSLVSAGPLSHVPRPTGEQEGHGAARSGLGVFWAWAGVWGRGQGLIMARGWKRDRQLRSAGGIPPSETHFPIPGPPRMHSWTLTRLGLPVNPGLQTA